MFIALLYILSFLSIVPSVDTVLPGQLFTVTVTSGATFDSGGLEVVGREEEELTTYVTLRAAGEPRDVVLRAWDGGREVRAVVRVCCLESAPPADPTRRVFLPVVRR